MISATCHCGAITVRVPQAPTEVTDCNCSICRRYGAHWAYYEAVDVQVTAEPGATAAYVWGDKRLRFVRCATCGCITHWERVTPSPDAGVGVNARNFDPEQLRDVRIRRLDGARTWKWLD
jgi:hypothetical protein